MVSGRDRHLAREVAWKVSTSDDPRGQARLRHEARVLAMLEHPNIVPVYDLVDDGASLRMATRYVRGRTLRALIHDPATAAPSFRQAGSLRTLRHVLAVAEALAFAHAKGVVHRDVKPDNIMVGEFGETQLIDWGLAAVLADDTTVGTVIGTPRHMSPEQARGERATPAVDVWGLGTVLFELLLRRPLWAEDHPDRILARVRHGHRPDLAAFASAGIPPELHAIVERALAPTPEARYPDARAFADDLEAFLDGRIVTAYDYSAWDVLRRFVRAWRLPLAIGLAVVVTLAIGLPLAFNRIGAERDEAIAAKLERTAALERAESTVALREHVAGQRPEAELAAANLLSLRESPEARGILAAHARSARFERRVRIPADALRDDCRDIAVSADERFVLCGTRTRLTVHRLEDAGRIGSAAFEEAGLFRNATLAAGALWFNRRDVAGVTRVDLATGARRQVESCGQVLVPLPDGVLDYNGFCASIITDSGARKISHGFPELFQTAAGDADTTAALRIDGVLELSDDQGARQVATGLASITRDWVSAVWYRGDARRPARFIVGSTRGEILALDATSGKVVARAKIEPDSMVRGLSLDRARDLLLARIDSGGAVILDAQSLALIGRLPRAESNWAALLGDGRVASFGTHLSLWTIPPGPVAELDGLVGVTSLALAEDGMLLTTYERSAALIDTESGRTVAGMTVTGPDPGIAKSAVLRGPDVIVAVAKQQFEALPQPPSAASTDPAFLEMRGYRRLVSLPDGRVVRAPTGVALELELPGTATFMTLDNKRVVDIAVSGAMLASLTSYPSRFAVWDLAGPPLLHFACADEGASSIALTLTADGPLVLTSQLQHVLAVRPDCSVRNVFQVPRGEPVRVAATANLEHGWVAAGTRGGDIIVWDWDGNLRATVPLHLEPVTALVLDPTQRWLVSGAWDGRVRFLDLAVIDAPVDSLVRAVQSAWSPSPGPPTRSDRDRP